MLVVSEDLSADVMRQMSAEAGVPLTFAGALSMTRGRKVAVWVSELEQIRGQALPASFIPRFRQQCEDSFDQRLLAVAGIETVLQQLDVPFCTASSEPRAKIVHTLARAALPLGPPIESAVDL